MAGRSRWEDGRRAWARLAHWWPYKPETLADESFGALSMSALEEVRIIRTVLDLAELHAVQTARLHGKTWVEISTRLGMDADAAKAKWGGEEKPERVGPASADGQRQGA